MRNVDRFVGIDWSGARSPVKSTAIALSYCDQGNNFPYYLTEKLSRSDVARWIEAQLKETKRLLVGIDCNFGYAESVGLKQFGNGYSYKDLWSAVEKSSKDVPNYFAGGFWTNTKYKPYFWTEGKQPDFFNTTTLRRITENQCRINGYGDPESPFKLIGAKQVGKGGLAGMRFAYDLKERFGNSVCFWPFERESTDQAQIIITEIYPRQFIRRAGLGNTKIRDLKTLNAALAYFDTQPIKTNKPFSDHLSDAVITAVGLRSLCGVDERIPQKYVTPKGLTENIAKREGWIFGVTNE